MISTHDYYQEETLFVFDPSLLPSSQVIVFGRNSGFTSGLEEERPLAGFYECLIVCGGGGTTTKELSTSYHHHYYPPSPLPPLLPGSRLLPPRAHLPTYLPSAIPNPRLFFQTSSVASTVTCVEGMVGGEAISAYYMYPTDYWTWPPSCCLKGSGRGRHRHHHHYLHYNWPARIWFT